MKLGRGGDTLMSHRSSKQADDRHYQNDADEDTDGDNDVFL